MVTDVYAAQDLTSMAQGLPYLRIFYISCATMEQGR